MAGLREQKKKIARDALAKAALELFSEKGFERTTVDEIALRAGVSRRSFFRYFTSKEEAAFPRQAERVAQIRSLLREYDARRNGVPAVRDACMAIARQYVAEKTERLARQRLVDSSNALRAFEQQADLELENSLVEELVGDSKDAVTLRRAKVFAAAVIGLVRVVLREWFDSEATLDLEAVGRTAFEDLERGFRFP